jgi:hypothetical protein
VSGSLVQYILISRRECNNGNEWVILWLHLARVRDSGRRVLKNRRVCFIFKVDFGKEVNIVIYSGVLGCFVWSIVNTIFSILYLSKT